MDECNCKGINYPLPKNAWENFAKKNPIFALSVLHVKKVIYIWCTFQSTNKNIKK